MIDVESMGGLGPERQHHPGPESQWPLVINVSTCGEPAVPDIIPRDGGQVVNINLCCAQPSQGMIVTAAEIADVVASIQAISALVKGHAL